MTNWITSEIVTCINLRKRIVLLKYFIDVGVYCLKYNNFNAVMEIVSALNQTPVQRLKLTWNGLPSHSQKQFEFLNQFMSQFDNYKEYRKVMSIIKEHDDVPCTPYIGVYLQDLLSIEELETTIDKLINLKKLRRISHILETLERCSSVVYDFEYNTSLHRRISNAKILNNDDQYKYSKMCEDRKR